MRAVELEMAAQRYDAIAEAQQPASVRAGASDAVVGDVDQEAAVLDPGRHVRVLRAACFATFVSASATKKCAVAPICAGKRSSGTETSTGTWRVRRRSPPHPPPGHAR